jgi:hypothetical protein
MRCDFLAFFVFLQLGFSPVFGQDTIYYDRNYTPVPDAQSAYFMEVKVCDSVDLSRCALMGYWMGKNQLISVERYSDFDNGILDGRWTEWSFDGKIWHESTYKNGKRQGAQKRFYPNGQLYQKIVWDNDTILSGTFFKEDGSPNRGVSKDEIVGKFFQEIANFPRKGYHISRFIRHNINYPETAKRFCIGNRWLNFLPSHHQIVRCGFPG